MTLKPANQRLVRCDTISEDTVLYYDDDDDDEELSEEEKVQFRAPLRVANCLLLAVLAIYHNLPSKQSISFE